MSKKDRPAEEHEPDDVEHDLEETGGRSDDGGSAEGPEREAGELERLDAERDPDDRDAHDQSTEEIAKREPESGENKPEEIADGLHPRTLPPGKDAIGAIGVRRRQHRAWLGSRNSHGREDRRRV